MGRFPMHTFQQDAILARLSQALVALEVSNVKSLTSEQCNKLQCGDVVVKKDSSGEHSYVVTFKSDTGMCLTYMDASVIETQSYDKGESGWVYNSEDKTPNLLEINEFDGDVVVTHPALSWIITPDNFPRRAGIYKLVYGNSKYGRGFICITLPYVATPQVYSFWGIFDGGFFRATEISFTEDFSLENTTPLRIVPNNNVEPVSAEYSLTSLIVGSVRYNVSGGTKLYNHHIMIYNQPYQNIEFDIISNFNDVLSLSNYKTLVLAGSYPTYYYKSNIIAARKGISPILVTLNSEQDKFVYSYVDLSSDTYSKQTGNYPNITDTVTEL